MQNYFETIKSPIFSADFHYFRLSREKWELMLTRLVQMGATMITITVPWGFHEFEKGTIDLAGVTNARHDLLGLLDLCAALNLHCLLKTGPYSHNCDILNNGLPHWLSPASDNFEATLAAATSNWYQALSKAVADRQWPNGPIVALHIDDDEAGQEEHPVYSEQLTEVKWPIWLRKRYKGIDALNEAYGTSYRSASDVPFPQSWSKKTTPLEADAREFLEEVEAETKSSTGQSLIEAGWQVPIYPSALEAEPVLPSMQSYSLAAAGKLPSLDPKNTITNLLDPIQVDPDPADIGTGPVWANDAPIRADGSLRRKFWDVRQYLWSHKLPGSRLDAGMFTASFEVGGLATSGQDMPLKISLTKGAKPVAYRLGFNGEAQINDDLKVARGKLGGPYLAEDETSQTDLIFFLNDPTVPLDGFLLTHLQTMLNAQAQTLNRAAALAAKLGKMLGPAQASTEAKPAKSPKPTSYTLREARRGLREADAILRKAVASVGGLEAGFDVMLNRKETDIPEPATSPVEISPEIFEGSAREILIEAGKVLTSSVSHLKSAGKALQSTIDSPQGFTVEQYQQSYAQATLTAQETRQSLLEIIAKLRVEMASEKLPLVAWRVHNQIQEIAENLRWGVLRN